MNDDRAAQTTKAADRLIDIMLGAQSRLAADWRDGAPLTPQQERDEAIRDKARADLTELVEGLEDVP